MEQLGQANAPGPFVETFVAVQLLDAERVEAIVTGAYVATVTTSNSLGDLGNLVPWLPIADTVIEIDGSRAHLVRVAGEVVPVDSLAGEPWGRAAIEHGEQPVLQPVEIVAMRIPHVPRAAIEIAPVEHEDLL
jgi:hypothetical protein